MKKTLEFVEAMRNTSIPSPFMIALESGRLDATEAGYLANLVAELAAMQAACKLAGDKLSGEEIDIIAEFLGWERALLVFISASFSESGLLAFDLDYSCMFDSALSELKKMFALPEADG